LFQTKEVGNPAKQEEKPKCEVLKDLLRYVPQKPGQRHKVRDTHMCVYIYMLFH